MRPQLASRFVVATLLGALVSVLGSAGPAGAVFPGNLRGEVAFTSDRDGDAELYAMTNAGLGQRRLTVRRSQEVGASLAVEGLNPFNDGAVAYASDRDGNWDVYVLRVGLDERRLTTQAGGDFGPAFSPRGDEIAFTSDRTGNRDVFVVSSTVAESGLRNLTAHPAEDGGASWSSWVGQPRPPDSIACTLASPRIAFHSNRAGSFDIWVVPETGGAAVQVTSGPGADLNPNWSPRCDLLAFERRTGTNYDIWVVRLSDGALTRLTSGPAADTDPVWAPNGTAIAFTSDRDGNEEIYRLELSLGPPLAPAGLTNLSQSPAAADYAPEWEARDFTFSEGLIVAPAAGGGARSLTCTRRGNAKKNTIDGTSGPDVICGLGGNDTLRGLGGDDVLIGGLGRDRLRGGNGRDELRARDGFRDFELVGGAGVDRARYDEGWDPKPAVESAL
jgi:Tol biopolymer transport system component